MYFLEFFRRLDSKKGVSLDSSDQFGLNSTYLPFRCLPEMVHTIYYLKCVSLQQLDKRYFY